jgi:hypothetical protein
MTLRHGGEQSYNSHYSFLTSALDGGWWSTRRLRALTPGKEPPIGTGAEKRKTLARTRVRTLTVPSVASRYIDYANPEHRVLGGYMTLDYVSALDNWHDFLFVVPEHILL